MFKLRRVYLSHMWSNLQYLIQAPARLYLLLNLVEAEVQSLVDVPILQQKPTDQRRPLVDTTVTLIPETTLSPKQPPQSRRKTKVLLKKSKKPDTQVDVDVLDNRLTRLEKKVDAMSKFNTPEAIDKSVQAYLKKNVLPKDVHDFGEIRQEKTAKQSMPKYATTPFDEDYLMEYDQKDKLKMMMKSKLYDKHPAYRALYDALVQSLIVDEDDMDKQLEDQSTPKKRR
ncbi:hypothetical protein Tco_0378646 [Tanacetum coccineum]